MTSFTEYPNVRCPSCSKVIAQKHLIYKELLDIGYSPTQAFEVIDIKRWCCRTRISLPQVIPDYSDSYDSIASVPVDVISQNLIISIVKENSLIDPSLEYVAKELLENRKIKPVANVIETREKIREKEIVGEKVYFNLEGDRVNELPKRPPVIKRKQKGLFDVKKVGSGVRIKSLEEIAQEEGEKIIVVSGRETTIIPRVINISTAFLSNRK